MTPAEHNEERNDLYNPYGFSLCRLDVNAKIGLGRAVSPSMPSTIPHVDNAK